MGLKDIQQGSNAGSKANILGELIHTTQGRGTRWSEVRVLEEEKIGTIVTRVMLELRP